MSTNPPLFSLSLINLSFSPCKVTARLNKKLSGVNSDIKKQLELHAERRERLEERSANRKAREELCNEVIRSALV